MNRTSVPSLLKALSSSQWLKNGLIFIPAIFAAVDWDLVLTIQLVMAFWGFSLLASAVYINNDLIDKASDQLHPEKKKRAIASGAVSRSQALMLMLVFVTVGLATLFVIGYKIALFGSAYLVINAAYSSFLKKIPVLDVGCILSGYFIRLLIGQDIANAPLSPWIIGFVALLALYLILLKRHGDVQQFLSNGILHRETVPFYSRLSLPRTTFVLAQLLALFFAAYIHFVFAAYPMEIQWMPYITIPLAYFALLSYHRSAIQNIQNDPILNLLRNYWSLALGLTCFIILIVSRYIS